MIHIENLKMISEEEVQITNVCPSCSKPQTITITVEQYWKLIDPYRRSIHSILTDKFPHEREILITGICHSCWLQMFAEGEN